ncbi:hypothetical protein [Deinococcus cellulosilyticus]|uniref:Uncharacterized protein n=1 Tax=Deinococcus cellulosilyticus (strain DSM 18568 / NBRC 106333 / KACC 11606 / 5516J-15) TaxID=1223518 RepID=A0A511MY22_DEIC1|nr:hypothetical protein [Deinococcus cellulosilyticus]GEM45037.1 hypothetical protein DC3_06720 [Deinococcus cellulosilyticus NBRC 106333 = KACC 11606]
MSHIEMEARLRYQAYQQEADTLHLLKQAPRTSMVHQLAESLRSLADHLDMLQPGQHTLQQRQPS